MERARTRRQTERGDASTAAAWRYAGDHAGRLPVVAAVRVLRTFDLFQPLRQGNREVRRRWVDVIGAGFVWAVLLAAVIGWRRLRGRRRWPLLAPVAMVVLVSALGWGIGRFRVGADVTLLVLAAAAVTVGALRDSTDSAQRVRIPQIGNHEHGPMRAGQGPPARSG